MITDNQSKPAAKKQQTLGDTAVDGLFAGLLAGGVMLAALTIAAWLTGEQPAALVGRFDPAFTGRWLPGLVAHLAVSAVYGVLFAIAMAGVVGARPLWARWSWLFGLAYGLLLWSVAQQVLLTAVASPLRDIPELHLPLAHALYGLLLGIILRRR